ncbi:MAG: IPT/TIG domain-containing protein [Armatimonadia bacterium]
MTSKQAAMCTNHLLVLSLALLLTRCACAQVGVETGVSAAGHAGSIEALRRLGSAVSRSVFGSTGAIPAPATRLEPPSVFSMPPGASTVNRSFVPRTTGQYVAGVAWRSPGDAPVTLKAGAQEAIGTTAATLLLHFEAPANTLCTVGVSATGNLPPAGLAGDLDLVRDVRPGEPPSKSLLTPEQRLAEFTRRGPRQSVLPLLANLASRHLASAQPATDLDAVFDRALASAPQVTPADLQALIRDYDALSETVKLQCFTSRTLALRSLPAPTLAGVSALFTRPRFGPGSGYSGAMTAAAPRIDALEPAVPAGGAYAPGATIHIVGENFAPQPERNQVYLGPELSRLISTRPLPVVAASPTALTFQLPADLPDGSLYLLIMVDRRNSSRACSLRIDKAGVNTPPAEAAAPAGPTTRYRLSCVRIECVDETNPEWWGNDDVVLLMTAVGDGQAVTRASGPLRGFSDGAAQPLAEADRTLLPEARIARGIGVAAELWRCNPPAPSTALGSWALRESFANALVAPEAQFNDPKPQDDVSSELAVSANPIGYQEVVWTAADLLKLLQPGQKLEKILDLRQADAPAQYDVSGYYKLTLELERLD